MRHAIISLALAAAFSAPAAASDKGDVSMAHPPVGRPSATRAWTPQEKRWAALAVTAGAIDWLQTRNIARNPDRWRERNPRLPDHPTIGQVNRHFATGLVAGALIAHFVPEYRLPFLRTVAVVQFGFALHNAHMGISIRF